MENEQVTVLFVFNGPHNGCAGQWDLPAFLKKRKALGDVDANQGGGQAKRSSAGSTSNSESAQGGKVSTGSCPAPLASSTY